MNDGKTYEEVAKHILYEQRDFFGLERVEGKQDIPAVNGTTYEIDVVAYRKGDERLVLFECRDYNKKLNQEAVGGFAYRIQVIGAAKGYMITPIGLQAGAKLVADYEKIGHITIPRGSTPESYVVRFLNNVLAKVTDHAAFQDRCRVEVVRAD
jgi:hypothetical protein